MPIKKKKRVPNIIAQTKAQMRLLRYSFLATVALVLTVAVTPAPKLTQTPIRIPDHVTQLSYSGPLSFETLGVSVLGAATIDPIDFVNEINKERAKISAPALRLSTVLMKAAQMRADVILKHQNFSHQDPHEGIELGTVLPKLNYHYIYAAENIGMGGVSAPDFVNGFMNSTHHKATLLDPRLTETGAAIVDGPYFQYYVNIAVQLFSIPGGPEEMLGYTAAEKIQYEKTLTALSGRLNPIRRFTQQILGNPEYSDTSVEKFTRQKKILETVLTRMRNNEPLQNNDVALILEYNGLL